MWMIGQETGCQRSGISHACSGQLQVCLPWQSGSSLCEWRDTVTGVALLSCVTFDALLPMALCRRI